MGFGIASFIRTEEMRSMLGALLLPTLVTGLSTQPIVHALPVPLASYRSAASHSSVTLPSSGAVFPPADSPGLPASLLVAAKNCNEEACTEEEAAEAKFEAQRLFAFIVFVSGVPSLWAQDELVWKKERQGKQVFGGKKSAKKGANKRR